MSRPKIAPSLCLPLLLSSLIACSSEPEPTDARENHNDQEDAQNNDRTSTPEGEEPTLDPETPTYHRDIAPLVQTQCGGCHVSGGIGPFELDTYDKLAPLAALSLDSMERGSMPPWMPDPECNSFVGERLLSVEELDTFRAWAAAGSPEGDPAEAPSQALAEPIAGIEATHVAKLTEGYMADADVLDDYRCFIFDTEFPEDLYLTASQVIPGDALIVHHVLVYAVRDELMPQLEAADAAEDGPGYTCFGSPYPADLEVESSADVLPNQISAWVPGLLPTVFDQGKAIRIDAGSKIVMQVHYNLLNAQTEPDVTELHMQLTDEPPELLHVTKPLPIQDFEIPAGQERAVWTRGFTNYRDAPITITSMSPHMHKLGKEFHARVYRAGSDEGTCALDIPAWDFAWQQSYIPLPGEEIVLQPGDRIEVECVWDNSPANQPVIDGEQIMPREVVWGEGTFDEMCLLYVGIEEPWVSNEEPDVACEGKAQACASACETDPSVDCLMSCADSPPQCTLCLVDEAIECATPCLGKLLAARECLTQCGVNSFVLGGPIGACAQAECGQEYNDWSSCVDEQVAGGACAEMFSSCGADF